MHDTAYVCATCGHMFRPPDDAPRDTRSLMCPACGSIDLSIVTVQRAPATVMRARTPVGTARHDDGIPGSG
jgi:DNA-directed RNA polymerase subunit RPC12/RpoP